MLICILFLSHCCHPCCQTPCQSPVSKVLQLQDGQDCILIGTAFKDMKLRFNVLDEYIKDRGLGELTGRTRFASEDDTLVLEDEAARVQLQAEAALVSPGGIVTGAGNGRVRLKPDIVAMLFGNA